ncbi:TauD/TfdA family dioxygenase [Sphaerisporangium sp. NPDC005289]|uniref:TauD/TfdA family dioxygenase n=1 Tax=Sphaerisporangium sp. NPDC005289 TaxID=3155247 RepID=UPI0033B809A5
MTTETTGLTAPSESAPTRAPRRRAIRLSELDLVTIDTEGGLSVLVRPRVPGVDLARWLKDNHERVERLLGERGAIRFQGFDVTTAAAFESVSSALSPELLNYVYGSTPRSREKGGVYTSTEYPPDQTIPQHNEMAYSTRWPMKLWFYCQYPAAAGGETPLADSRRVLRRIDPALRARFAERGVRYVRNYGGGLDLSWQRAFETDDRGEAERTFRDLGISYEWFDGGRLRTWQVCQAVVSHPVTGEAAWFNQAHLFHPSSLPAEVRESLLASSGEEDLPRNALYGDGTPIEESALEEVRAAFAAETVAEPWSAGEVLLIDNVLMSHGRRPYEGPRKVLVAMTDPNPVPGSPAAGGEHEESK